MRIARRHEQRGLALMVMVTALILGGTFVVVTSMNGQARSLARAVTTNNVLGEAKQALIGRAAVDVDRPGSLPCPDLNVPGSANEGTAAATCASASQRIGRLPWKTLNLPDLRDASGERLWYALSDNFRDTGVVNSETLGTLTVTGTAPSTAIVAIVFAPGAALSGQNRDPTISANLLTLSNYLEGENADAGNNDVFVTAPASDTFNDRLLAISHADLFNIVEANVAKRIETDVKPFINSYVTQWGAYPFAMPFASPGATQNYYKGTVDTTYGLLPVTLDPAFLSWRIPLASEQLVAITGNAGTATGTLTSDCSATTATVFSCQIVYTYTGGAGSFEPYFSVTPALQYAGMALVDKSQITVPSSKVHIYSAAGVTEQTYGTPGTATYAKPTWNSNTLRTDGGADMLFLTGRMRSTTTTRTRNLKITWSGSTSQYLYTAGIPSDWFFTNQWYRLTYYAISTGYAPGQANSCVSGGSPLCLTANNLTAPNADKGAVLVLAGRAAKKTNGTTDQVRPSGVITDYLEGRNVTSPGDSVFESSPRSGAAGSSINDRIVVLAP